MTRQAGIFERDYHLTLTDRELEAVLRPIAPGDWGGHQHFEHEMQQRLEGHQLTMTDSELDRAFKFGYAYGDGTWQNYARALVAAGRRAGWQVPDTSSDSKMREAIAYYLFKMTS